MIRKRSRRASLLVLLLALAPGCARLLAPPHQPIAEDAQRALTLVARRWSEFSDLRTLADLDVARGRDRQRLRSVVLAKAPASVRFEALSPMGQPFLIATVHDGGLVVYNVATNEAVVGPATAHTMATLLSLPFEPDDLVGVLAGRPAPLPDVRVAEMMPGDADGPSLVVVNNVHQQRIWMDFVTGVVRQVEITGGLYEVRVTYDRGPQGDVQGFRFSAPRANVTGRVEYRDAVVDGGVDDNRFRMTPPDTAKIQRVR